MTDRFVCIHGHFYQPPRENAWLEEIEVQDSARPYHDWNERVTAESYAPNSASRILDTEDRIIDIVNNYSRISFDAGPTLLAWMERSSPDVYRAILQADKDSRARFRGHGSALAQAYSHLIMPLANSRDKRTQVIWGIRDFESRFRRPPEGMWLPETAVDLESLDLMAEQGIKFTVLAPSQAARTRPIGSGDWTESEGGRVDTKKPYLCRLPSGRTMALFFYDGPISHDVAFGRLLHNGEFLARRLAEAFSEDKSRAEMVNIATDGETYGHHHRFGDMALAYGLYYLEKNQLAKLTVYGDYLERFPPADEAEVAENTSWSCGHGVERWRSNCGDSSGTHFGWNQEWRAPLRKAMDWLRDRLSALFEKSMSRLTGDPWGAREDYIQVILDRSSRNIESFFSRNFRGPLPQADKVKVLKLLEMQRQSILMFTSDGWFFDDISNIETIQVIQYAARAIQLARDLDGRDLEPEYVRMLQEAKSNVPEHQDGSRVYEKYVRPAVVDFRRLGAHFAVSSLFKDYPRAARVARYAAVSEVCHKAAAGKSRLAAGRVKLTSEVTLEERTVCYAVVHFGDQNLTAGVNEFADPARFEAACREIKEAFARGDLAAVIRLIDRDFGSPSYSLWHLFTDERRKVLGQILDETLTGLESVFRQIFESNRPAMQALREMQIPLPEALSTPAQFVLNADFRRLVEKKGLDLGGLRKLIDEFKTWSFKPDRAALGYILGKKISALMTDLASRPDDLARLKAIDDFLALLQPLFMDLNLWESQNIYFSMGKQRYSQTLEKAGQGDRPARDWVEAFDFLGNYLRVKPAAAPEK